MKWSWSIEGPQLLILAAMFAAAAWAWPDAAEQLPVHWNASGEVDRLGGRFEGLALLPLITAGVYVALRWLPALDPGRANYERFAGVYNGIRIGFVVFMGVIYLGMRVEANSGDMHVIRYVGVLTGLGIAILGLFLGKIRPNWFVGIRTPWTLSSKRSWTRTHRIGGPIFTLYGVSVALTSLIQPDLFVFTVIGGALLMIVITFWYSYVVYKQDPDKIHPSGTTPAEDHEAP